MSSTVWLNDSLLGIELNIVHLYDLLLEAFHYYIVVQDRLLKVLHEFFLFGDNLDLLKVN